MGDTDRRSRSRFDKKSATGGREMIKTAESGLDQSPGPVAGSDDKQPGNRIKITKAALLPEIQSQFQTFQKSLDAKNDKWERLVKSSRDITIESKRVIFLLHRVTREKSPAAVLEEAENRLNALKSGKFCLIAKELFQEDPYQFLYSFRPGLQEFIEAVSFLHYLKEETLIGYKDLSNSLQFQEDEAANGASVNTVDQNPPPEIEIKEHARPFKVLVTCEDFLCGVGDLSGELMRLAINFISSGDFDRPPRIVGFLRCLYEGFCLIGRNITSRDFNQKLRVMRQNLSKVENACYVLKLRGTEIPQHMLVDVVTSSFFNECPDETHQVDFPDT